MEEPTYTPPSMEVMTEQFYDAAAWLRDLPITEWPTRAWRLAVTLNFETHVTVRGEDGEERIEPAIMQIEVQRYEDGVLHIHGGGVCSDVDQMLLASKRPLR